jgi:hypothetical protein
LTKNGSVVSVNISGEYRKNNVLSGAAELVKTIQMGNVQRTYCILRLDERTVIGAPFIAQRFWKIDLVNGLGTDLGRAAPGSGQVCKMWSIGGKAYWAAYTGGELMQFDPALLVNYPMNPSVVAAPPRAMRPLGAANDARYIFYSCSAPYGNLGSVVVKYDTVSGRWIYSESPLPDQKIVSLAYDSIEKKLLFGSSFHADGFSAVPTSNNCYFGTIDENTLAIAEKARAPIGTYSCDVIGALGNGRYLCTSTGASGAFMTSSGQQWLVWFVIDEANIREPANADINAFPEGTENIIAVPVEGRFILKVHNSLELWDLNKNLKVRTIEQEYRGYAYFADSSSLYIIEDGSIKVLHEEW